MQLSPSDDQRAILGALDTLAKPYETIPIGANGFALTSSRLDAALAEAGFLDVGSDPELGAVTAAMVIERLARLPYTSEAALSALIGPLLDPGTARPLCLVEAGRDQPVLRFLRDGATVLVLSESEVRAITVTAPQVRAEPDALFAYPMGTLLTCPPGRPLAIDPVEVLARWQVAIAAEAAGLLRGALTQVCSHVRDRQQFGRPLASFQAIRHRLAEAEVRAKGVYWLALNAAASLDPADTAIAAGQAQDAIKTCVYDFHQFLGAMGMALEHPLHLWTYRLRALASELGGRGRQAAAAADRLWPPSDGAQLLPTNR